jgi:hypothetical protein
MKLDGSKGRTIDVEFCLGPRLVAYGRALDPGRRTFAPSGPSSFRSYGHAPELRRIRPDVDREAKKRQEGIVALFMMQNTITMRRNKNIALVAHDNKKEDLFE